MSELDIQISTTFDPFVEANTKDMGVGAKEYVHVRREPVVQRESLHSAVFPLCVSKCSRLEDKDVVCCLHL
uniref:Uncharacterized protein n=1 Tax=Nelumbo nucifera TaxID=4432 RepID=A0A822XDL8_NELNU|nr:TPA_asm: hypothetical protein HUJ06_020997 [Nelumbo nucifera]